MNNWYFPRQQLAQHYLKVLGIGISSNIGMVAPRRKGKTLFLLNDIASAAKQAGFFPVYASLWQNVNKPQEGIILALTDAIQSLDNKFSLNRLLGKTIKKVTLSNEIIGNIEIEFANKPEKTSNKDLILIDQLLSELIKKTGKKKVLLLIDEIQHLATSKVFDPLAYALRTMIDKRSGQIVSIMTGSSRHYMNLLFNQSQSPFYHFIDVLDFPDLGVDFLEFIATETKRITSKSIKITNLKKAFHDLDLSPYWIMKSIRHMISYDASLTVSVNYILDIIETAEDFEGIKNRMKDIDKIVYLALANNESPFSDKVLQEISTRTTLKGIAPNVQRSLKRLMDQHIISQIKKGEYIVEKPGLKRYLLDDGADDD